MSGLNVFFSDLHICSQDFSDQVLTVEPTNKMPALICRCLQTLAEALKTNASITNINLGSTHIGDEGAKAWCVVGSVECFDSDKFRWFGGAVVSSFISVQGKLSNV